MSICHTKTNPNLPCLIALRMSSNIPAMFEPFKYTKSYYIDGAYGNNFAIECLEEKDHTLGVYLDPVEGLYRFSKSNWIYHTMRFNSIKYIVISTT